MAMTQVDKIKIIKYFRETPFGNIYYRSLVDYLGKKSKITDAEFTDFFASYIIENLKKEKPPLSLIMKMISTITTFIGWLYDDKIELDCELVNKLYSIRESYEQYLVQANEERNNSLEELITTFEDDLNKFYPPVEEEIETIDVDTLMAEIETLRKNLTDSEKEVSDLTLKLSKQAKGLEGKRKDNDRLNARLNESKQKQKNLEAKVRELESLIEQLNSLVTSLKGEITSANEKYSILDALKDRIQADYFSLKTEMKSLRKNIEDKNREIARLNKENEFKIIIPRSIDFNEERDNKIEGLIIQKMLEGKSSLEDIKEYLAINGYVLTLDELRNYFKIINERMKYEISCDESLDGSEGAEYVIPISNDAKSIDLMVVSDFHLLAFCKDTIHDMELINDYCEDNGIHMILNVGDFFSWTRLKGKHEGSACRRIVEKAIVKYPSRKGIKHAVLDGNHDKDMLVAGVDPIKLLAEEREDFISLGYGHCKISFGGSFSILDSIGMHHPNRRYPNSVGKDFYTTEKIMDTISSYYAVSGINADDFYVQLVGHIHKSGLDTENGICIVPSYLKDRVINGAWHLKVYFSEDRHISNIVFMPVIKQKALVKISEISYKKQLIKK